LLDRIDGPIASFTADGAYDQGRRLQRGRCPSSRSRGHRATAFECGGRAKTADTAPTPRDRHLQAIAETWPHGLAESVGVQLGVPWWKPISAAGNGSSVMRCGARKNRQASKQPKRHSLSTSSTACWRWGRPSYVPLCMRAQEGLGSSRPSADPCNKVPSAPLLCLPARLLAGQSSSSSGSAIAHRDACTTHKPGTWSQGAVGDPGGGRRQRIAMLPRAGEVERKIMAGQTFFFLQRSFLERRSPAVGQSQARAATAVCATDIGAAGAPKAASTDAGYVCLMCTALKFLSARWPRPHSSQKEKHCPSRLGKSAIHSTADQRASGKNRSQFDPKRSFSS